MNQGERGQENLQNIEDRNSEELGQKGADRTRLTTNGEAAGGDHQDVPGGAYNVPSGMAEEVSDEQAGVPKDSKR